MTLEGGVAPALTAEMLSKCRVITVRIAPSFGGVTQFVSHTKSAQTLVALLPKKWGWLWMPITPGHHGFQAEAVLAAVQGAALRSAHAFRVAFGP